MRGSVVQLFCFRALSTTMRLHRYLSIAPLIAFAAAQGKCRFPNGTLLPDDPAWNIYQPCLAENGPITTCCALARSNPPYGNISLGYTQDECLPNGLCMNRITSTEGERITTWVRSDPLVYTTCLICDSSSITVQKTDRKMKQRNAPTCARLETKSSQLKSRRATGQRTALSGVVAPARTVAAAIRVSSPLSWRRFWELYHRVWSARVRPRRHQQHRRLRRPPHLEPHPRLQQQRTLTVQDRRGSVEER